MHVCACVSAHYGFSALGREIDVCRVDALFQFVLLVQTPVPLVREDRPACQASVYLSIYQSYLMRRCGRVSTGVPRFGGAGIYLSIYLEVDTILNVIMPSRLSLSFVLDLSPPPCF